MTYLRCSRHGGGLSVIGPEREGVRSREKEHQLLEGRVTRRLPLLVGVSVVRV